MTRRDPISLVRIGTATALGAGALWALTFGAPAPEVRLSVAGGYPVPEFRLPVLNAGLFLGDTTFIDSEELRGGVTLVAFWATWCSPCIAEQPSLLALQREFADEGLRVLAVLTDDSPRVAFDWLNENERTELRERRGHAKLR